MPVTQEDIIMPIEAFVAKYLPTPESHIEDPEILKLSKAKLTDMREKVYRKENVPLEAIAASVRILREGRFAAAASKSKKAAKAAQKAIPLDVNKLFSDLAAGDENA